MEPKDEKDGVSRRGFLRDGLAIGFLSLTAAAGVCLCQGGCKRPADDTPVVPVELVTVAPGKVSVLVGKVEPLQKVGGAAKIVHPNLKTKILLIRPSEARYLAFQDRCTHRGAEVRYDPVHHHIVCVNYGHSVYSLSGTVLKGPAPRPLPSYRTLLVGGTLEIFL